MRGIKTQVVRCMPILAAAIVLCGSIARAQPYRLGRGDVLDLQVWNEPELNCKVEIGSDGMAEFPFIGEVKADDVTVDELEKQVEQKLADGYLKDPQIKLTVEEYRSKEVYVLGAVQKPGAVPLRRDMRLVELLAQAGAKFSEGGDEILVVRHEVSSSPPEESTPEEGGADEQEKNPGNQPEVLRISANELLHGSAEANVLLRNRDTVLFPPKGRAEKQVYVLGNVEQPGPCPVEKGMSLAKLVATVGAMTDNPGMQVTITRKTDKEAKSVTYDVRDVVLGKDATNFELQDGDVLLFVQPQTRYFVIGEVKAPGAFRHHQGLTVREGIIYAGWITRRGDLEDIEISRKVDGEWKEIEAKLSDPLQPGDVIRVQERWF